MTDDHDDNHGNGNGNVQLQELKEGVTIDDLEPLEDSILVEKTEPNRGLVKKLGPQVLGVKIGEVIFMHNLPDFATINIGDFVLLTECAIERVGTMLIAKNNILEEVS